MHCSPRRLPAVRAAGKLEDEVRKICRADKGRDGGGDGDGGGVTLTMRGCDDASNKRAGLGRIQHGATRIGVRVVSTHGGDVRSKTRPHMMRG